MRTGLKNKKKSQKTDYYTKNAFYGEKKSACGTRTGFKNKKNYQKMIITQKNVFYE